MARRMSRGRQKIEKEGDRYATFSKRHVWLFKKASELCTLCDVDIGIIILSPTEKPFSFFHPTIEFVVNRYYHKESSNNSSDIFETYVRSKVNALNETLDDISERIEFEKKLEEHLNEIEQKHTVKDCCAASVGDEIRSILRNDCWMPLVPLKAANSF
ncbi:agamous-like MADS-box protein AGL61 [Olea europaea var. sylvestris]|uniref:agamous-like MADS-box protein AGL61 n=1 Tax=Olea europaea var. sylvestris TaxID=158386 RepID=UPI000C1CEC0D|nr:agamous-like MADS-box protein AGL61 [Olea europaea var. sylvestris]